MEIGWIVLVVLVGIWLLNLAVFGILALAYHHSHTPLMQERNLYYKQWHTYKDNVNLEQLFLPLAINYELPKGEKVYYLDIENAIYLYSKKTQEYKSLRKMEGKYPKLAENYFADMDIISLKSGLSLGFKETKKPIVGDVYISNKRIIINDMELEKSQQVRIDQVLKAYIAMIYVGKSYARGYVIQTPTELYEIVTNNPEAVLIVNELLRKRGKKSE